MELHLWSNHDKDKIAALMDAIQQHDLSILLGLLKTFGFHTEGLVQRHFDFTEETRKVITLFSESAEVQPNIVIEIVADVNVFKLTIRDDYPVRWVTVQYNIPHDVKLSPAMREEWLKLSKHVFTE